MRFSTRNTHKHGKAIALAVGAAVLGIGGTISYLNKREASAETSSIDGNIFFANTADFTSLNDAASTAATVLGVENATFCNIGSSVGGAITRTDPKTGENAEYWVFAKAETGCPSDATVASQGMILNNNGATFLTNEYTFEHSILATRYNNDLVKNGQMIGAFHIIAFNELTGQVQVYGNAAAKNLISESNNNLQHFTYPTISYLKNVSQNVNIHSFSNDDDIAHKSSQLALGETVAVSTARDGVRWAINNNIIEGKNYRIYDGTYLNNVFQEYTGGPVFLDFDTLKSQAVSYNQTLASYSAPDSTISESSKVPTTSIELGNDGTARNNNYIRIPTSTTPQMYVMDVNATDFNIADDLGDNTTEIQVVGFDQNVSSTLLINIDLKDAAKDANGNYVISKKFNICYDDPTNQVIHTENDVNNQRPLREVDSHEYAMGKSSTQKVSCIEHKWIHDKFENQIILNYYDSSAADGIYTGKIKYSDGLTTAVTIAPKATVDTGGSDYQGIIIADNVNLFHDSYYLSFADNQPLFIDQPQTCTITVHHYLDGTMTSVADDETYTDVCGEVTEDIEASSTATQTYDVISAYYVEDDEVINKNDLPVEDVTNNIDKTYIIYYDKPLHLTVDHVWADGSGNLKDTDTDPNTYYADDDYDATGYVLTAGSTYDFSSYDTDPSNDPSTGDFSNRDIHVVYRYYRKTYTLTVNHYWEGETTPFATDNDPDTYTNQSSYSAGRYIKGHSALEYVTYYVGEGDPVNGNFSDRKNKVVNIVYTKQPQSCTIIVHHYKKGTEETVDPSGEIYSTTDCNNFHSDIDISQKALNDGYVFDSANETVGNAGSSYQESDFPLRDVTNDVPLKIITIYYDKPETPDTPNTAAKNQGFAFSAAGAVIGLGTAAMLLARRRQ